MGLTKKFDLQRAHACKRSLSTSFYQSSVPGQITVPKWSLFCNRVIDQRIVLKRAALIWENRSVAQASATRLAGHHITKYVFRFFSRAYAIHARVVIFHSRICTLNGVPSKIRFSKNVYLDFTNISPAETGL